MVVIASVYHDICQCNSREWSRTLISLDLSAIDFLPPLFPLTCHTAKCFIPIDMPHSKRLHFHWHATQQKASFPLTCHTAKGFISIDMPHSKRLHFHWHATQQKASFPLTCHTATCFISIDIPNSKRLYFHSHATQQNALFLLTYHTAKCFIPLTCLQSHLQACLFVLLLTGNKHVVMMSNHTCDCHLSGRLSNRWGACVTLSHACVPRADSYNECLHLWLTLGEWLKKA